MEIYDSIIKIVDQNIVYCLIPMILTLVVVKLIFKERFETIKALNIIRWFIIGYTLVTLIHFLIGIIIYPRDFNFLEKATGIYKILYWLMLACAIVLPFTLLIKKLAGKFWYVLLVAFLMKVGFYFERFVLLTSNLTSDYEPRIKNEAFLDKPLFGILLIIVQGIVSAILLVGTIHILKFKDSPNTLN